MNNKSLYNEKELISRLCGSDELALLHIYKHYWRQLYISAFNVLRDKAVCEDIIQEIFLQLWVNRANLKITVSLGAYLHAATRYQVFKHIRKENNRQFLFKNLEQKITASSADSHFHLKELNEEINSIVGTLPEQCRIIFKLSREAQLSHKEIAEQLNISVKTVENQITIALRKIRVSLGTGIVIIVLSLA